MDRELTIQLARITDPDPLMRADASRRLAAWRDPQVVTALLNALDDGEWRVRAAAGASLGAIGDRRAVFPLCRLLDDPKAEVRCAAIQALDTLGDPQVTASLMIALEREQDSEARRLIARTLGNIGDDRALRPLQRLNGDRHWAVRREATAATHRLLRRGFH